MANYLNETVEQRADRLVRQEVIICLSSLVHTLAKGYGSVDGSRGTKAHAPWPRSTTDLAAARGIASCCRKATKERRAAKPRKAVGGSVIMQLVQ